MPLAIAVIGFLILLGLSGGIDGGLAPQSNATSTVERESSRSTTSNRTATTRTSTSNRFDDSFALPGEVQGASIDYRLPTTETLAARNLESTSATLRGSVMLRTYKDGVVFAVYGYNEARVEALAKNYRSNNPAINDDRAEVIVLDRRANGSEAYERRVSGLVKDTK